SPPNPLSRPGRGGRHARPFRVALPLLPVWGVGRGREKRAGVMRAWEGGAPRGVKVSAYGGDEGARPSLGQAHGHPQSFRVDVAAGGGFDGGTVERFELGFAVLEVVEGEAILLRF